MSACCAFCECCFNCKTCHKFRLRAPLEKQHEIFPIIIMTQNLDFCMMRRELGYCDVAVWVSKG